jgi:hypothetical protein
MTDGHSRALIQLFTVNLTRRENNLSCCPSVVLLRDVWQFLDS